jgi:16S rRNA (guanine966-N2)-methyltransferase
MRIIGGMAKGRVLHFPVGSKERPTSDFLREALLNLLGPVADKSFLDLFAGSGSVGLEAASRGAKEVYFIEKNKILAEVAKKNIEKCGFEKKCRIINTDVRAGLNDLFKKKCKFDIIFADPPYNNGLVETTLKLLREYPVFQEDALMVIQHSTRESLGSVLAESVCGEAVWHQIDQRKYGDNAISFLKMELK